MVEVQAVHVRLGIGRIDVLRLEELGGGFTIPAVVDVVVEVAGTTELVVQVGASLRGFGGHRCRTTTGEFRPEAQQCHPRHALEQVAVAGTEAVAEVAEQGHAAHHQPADGDEAGQRRDPGHRRQQQAAGKGRQAQRLEAGVQPFLQVEDEGHPLGGAADEGVLAAGLDVRAADHLALQARRRLAVDVHGGAAFGDQHRERPQRMVQRQAAAGGGDVVAGAHRVATVHVDVEAAAYEHPGGRLG